MNGRLYSACNPCLAALERRVFLVVAGGVLVILAAIAWPAWRGEIYAANDLGAFHYPLRSYYASCLQRGLAWDWCPNLFSGYYLTGEGQAGTYHPLHWLAYRLLPLDAAFNLELLASYPLALLGCVVLLRLHEVRRSAAWLGGALFAFSSFNLLHLVHLNAIAVVAHIPWLLWAEHALVCDRDAARRRSATLAIALLTGSQVLLGYPQYVWFSLVAEFWYVLLVAGPLRGPHRIVVPLLAAKGLGLSLGLVQLLPTADALGASMRQAVEQNFAFRGSLHPGNLMQLVAPYLFVDRVVGGSNMHELALYPGAVTLLLAVWLLANLPASAPGRAAALALLAVGLIALDLSLGVHGALYRYQTLLPVVGKFRFPCRYSVVFQLSLALLAALGFDRLQRRASQRQPAATQWPLWALAATSAAVALLAAWRYEPAQLAAWPWRLVGPLVFLAAAGVISLATRDARWMPLVAALALLDVGWYGLSAPVLGQTARGRALAFRGELPPGPPGSTVAADLRRPGQQVSPAANLPALAGWRQVDGYVGLEPKRRLDYSTLPALRLAGVKWVASTCATQSVGGLEPSAGRWSAVGNPFPFARCVAEARQSDDPTGDLEQIDLETSAWTEMSLALDRQARGEVRLIGYHPGRIELAVNATGRVLLVLAESHHAGWRATIDDRQVPVLRVNGDFLGLPVPAGEHLVALRFSPTSLRLGAAGTMLGALIVSVFAVYAGWVARRRRGDAELALEF